MGAAVLLGGAAWLLLGSALFRATQVEVVGLRRLSAVDVRRAAAVDRSTPLVLLRTGAVASRVGALRGVASVRVSRSWPSEVRITVIERTPLLAVPAIDGYQLVDGAGVVFGIATRRPRGLTLAAIDAPGPDDRATRSAIEVLAAMPPRLRAAMARLEATSGDGVTLVLRDGRRVIWGSPERSGDKAAVLAALLRRKGRVYDVSAPDVVTVRRH